MSKFKDYAIENGFREAAKKMLESYFFRKYRFHLSELPDSVSMCETIDELEDIIQNNLENLDDDNVKNIVKLILDSFCEDDNIASIIME